MIVSKSSWLLILAAIALTIAGTLYLWQISVRNDLPKGLYAGNGRIEATEVKIAAKYPGRIVEIAPKEGDDVKKNKVVVRLDNREALAKLAEARADYQKASHVVHSARADIERRKRELAYLDRQLERTRQLFERGSASQQQLDRDSTAKRTAAATLEAAQAVLMQSEAQLASAQAQIDLHSAIVSDMEIKAPISGRVLFRISEPGEIIQAGGNILLLADLDHLYMTIYVDVVSAGKIIVGDEALIWTDAYPDKPFPAEVTFVSSEAEFTPKEVQTWEERQNLVFRVKIEVRSNDERLLKPGMPGVGLIRTDGKIPWPQSVPKR
jgi:HlyD family secretion protein